MANSGWTADPDDITIPPDAAAADSRIYIGSNDPLAQLFGKDKPALLFYWDDGKAFIMQVFKSGTDGILRLRTYDPVNGVRDFMAIDQPTGSPTLSMTVGDAGAVSPLQLFSGGDVIIAPQYGSQFNFPAVSENNVLPSNTPAPDVVVYGHSMARGYRNDVNSTASSAAIGITDTVVLTLPNHTYRAGRAYEVRMKGGLSVSAAGVNTAFRVRKTNAAGTVLGEYYMLSGPTAGAVCAAHGTGVIFTAPADITAVLVLTMRTDAGTSTHFAYGQSPRFAEVVDIGSSADYSGYPTLT